MSPDLRKHISVILGESRHLPTSCGPDADPTSPISSSRRCTCSVCGCATSGLPALPRRASEGAPRHRRAPGRTSSGTGPDPWRGPTRSLGPSSAIATTRSTTGSFRSEYQSTSGAALASARLNAAYGGTASGCARIQSRKSNARRSFGDPTTRTWRFTSPASRLRRRQYRFAHCAGSSVRPAGT